MCDNPYVGKYQAAGMTVDSLVLSWKPDMMLPRLYEDAAKWLTDDDFKSSGSGIAHTSADAAPVTASATSAAAATVADANKNTPDTGLP